ncbi:hypothetical protein JCM11641_000157 [Rhodosporidiobolus odoratus]
MPEARQLGLYERFSLARAQAGAAPTVAFTCTLPTSSRIESTAILHALDTLLGRYPLLRCAISHRTTTKPRFSLRASSTADDFFQDQTAEPAKNADDVLLRAVEAGQAFDLDNGPLWQVWRAAAAEGKSRVTLVVHHTLSDGSGTRNLFSELLSLLCNPAEDEEFVPAERLAASLEDTVNTKLSLVDIAKLVYSELLAPALPSFLQPIEPAPVFLSSPTVPPHLQPTALKLLSLSPPVVEGLKRAGKAQGVNTLHPILFTAANAALALTASSPTDPSIPSLRIVGSTPMSLRSPSVHPTCTGNYVCSHTESHDLSTLLAARFWTFCKDYSSTLLRPATRALARQGMGKLAYIPDGEVPATDQNPAKTRWEGWIEEQFAKQEWAETFEVSNLGVLPPTGWESEGLEDVYWTQTSSAFVSALEPVAVRGGNLTFTLSYRKNAVDEATVSRFWETYEDLLNKIAEGGVGEQAPMAELRSV